MYPGKPCFFVIIGKGCSDYENRPKSPCRDFSCSWISDEGILDRMSPTDTNIIATFDNIDGISYARLTKAGDAIDKTDLAWYINYYKTKNINIWFEEDGQNYVLGSDDFIDATKNKGYGTVRYEN
jgi:hypothetical protein